MNIKGDKITLRAVEEKDLTKLHEWANDPETQDIMGGIYFPSSMQFHKNWIKETDGDQLNKRFAIETPDGIIGLSSIMKIDWRNKNAWHGIMIGDKNIRGKGYGIDTVMTTMRYAFDEMGLERLDGQMIEYNEPSIGMYCKKLGWKKEGTLRNWYFRRGRFWDKVVVGITRKDYKKLIKSNNYWGKV